MSSGNPTSRIGWGFDAHRLDGDPPLKIGGVIVSERQGASATSDGDVLAHSVADALLGACVLGDLGEHFPSDDPASVGADSMQILARVVSMARDARWVASHVDVTVVAEGVRISPHRRAIAQNLANTLSIPPDAISVKATSTDGMGFIGRGEGLAAVAVVTVTPLL